MGILIMYKMCVGFWYCFIFFCLQNQNNSCLFWFAMCLQNLEGQQHLEGQEGEEDKASHTLELHENLEAAESSLENIACLESLLKWL